MVGIVAGCPNEITCTISRFRVKIQVLQLVGTPKFVSTHHVRLLVPGIYTSFSVFRLGASNRHFKSSRDERRPFGSHAPFACSRPLIGAGDVIALGVRASA